MFVVLRKWWTSRLRAISDRAGNNYLRLYPNFGFALQYRVNKVSYSRFYGWCVRLKRDRCALNFDEGKGWYTLQV
jgi:hypothetical protein